MNKEEILKLKGKGLSYAEIASITGANISTVKTIISRYKKAHHETICPVCGNFLFQTRGHRQKRFCSSHCKDVYWNRVRSKKNNK